MTDNVLIKIDSYLLGQLSATEKTAIESEWTTNPTFSEQVEQQRLHLQALDIMVQNDLHKKLKTWETQNPADQTEVQRQLDLLNKEKTGDKKQVFKWGVLTLAVLWGLGLFFYFYQKKTTPTETSPPKENGQLTPPQVLNTPLSIPTDSSTLQAPKLPKTTKKPNQLTTIAENYRLDLSTELLALEDNLQRGDDLSDDLRTALDKIKDKKYRAAADLLHKIPETNADYPDISFLMAACHYLSNDYGKAVVVFKKLAADGGYIRSERATWWLALSHIGEKQDKKARVVLNKIIADPAHPFHAKAVVLAGKLREIH